MYETVLHELVALWQPTLLALIASLELQQEVAAFCSGDASTAAAIRFKGSHAMFTSQLEELDTCYPSAIHAGSFPDESLEDQTLLESIQALSAAEVDQVVWPNRNPVIYEGRPVSEGRESSTTAATEFKQVLPKSRRSSTSGSCAPCQHQHKSCKENCDLKIPSMHPCKEPALKNWIKVHKAYGSSKIYKMVERTHRGDRERLMQSLIYEATCREKYPVCGAAGVHGNLSQKITKLEAANSKLQLRVLQLESALRTHALQEAHSLAGNYLSKLSREYYLQALALPPNQLHLPVSSIEGCHGYVHDDVKPPST